MNGFYYYTPKIATMIIANTTLNNNEIIQCSFSVILKRIFRIELISSTIIKTKVIIIISIQTTS